MKQPAIYGLSRKTMLVVFLVTALLACLVWAGRVAAKPVQDGSPKEFNTPSQAADALIKAAGSDDVAALIEILGTEGADIVSTGDQVADRNGRAEFVRRAKEKKTLLRDRLNANRSILYLGADEWPLPIPIVKQGAKWRFDAAAARNEILARRIGGNESAAIEVCLGFVEAQKEYAEDVHDGAGPNQYAQRIISTSGKHDGLYWKNDDGSAGGPIGDVVAKAIAQGYTNKVEPYHGYFFRVLKGQGPAAPLGAIDFVVKGAMIGGFALVAFPAEYRVTGVQTFIVSHDGVVYQKDLGSQTLDIAKGMELYNPDKTWKPAKP